MFSNTSGTEDAASRIGAGTKQPEKGKKEAKKNKDWFACKFKASETKILDQAKKEFPNVIFLSYEQKYKNIADYLKIDYWATIAVYKNNKEINRALGITSKEDIYSLIKQGV